MRVGYLGPSGTFSEEAAARYFAGSAVDWMACASIPDVLEAVEQGTVDCGVVPLENSLDGAVNVALDDLMRRDELFVTGEIVLPIEQHLLALPGATLDGIREIWSIGPALAQCHSFVHRLQARVRFFDSTANAAAELVQSQRTDAGAIASGWAAERLGLVSLAANIQDYQNNHTRFVIVQKGEAVRADANKTMLLIVPCEERAGVLAGILSVLAALQLNLTWIESRPTKQRLGQYQFIMDVEAGLCDDRMRRAVHILETFGHSVRVLGSFRAH